MAAFLKPSDDDDAAVEEKAIGSSDEGSRASSSDDNDDDANAASSQNSDADETPTNRDQPRNKRGPKKSRKNNGRRDELKPEPIDCPVCLGPAIFPIRIPCGHVFCFLCVKGAARQSNRCPMCRQHIPVDFDKNPTVLERQEIEMLDDGYQWFYEGKNGWWLYEKRTSREIEENYKLNNKIFDLLICGTLYTIDLERNIQYNRENPNRRRRLKREKVNNIAVKGIAGVY